MMPESERAAYRSRTTARRRLRGVEFRHFIDSIKAHVPCADCGDGSLNPWQLDFHHARGVKRFGIAKAPQRNMSLATFVVELEKCDLVCANCHRDRHWNDGLHRNGVIASRS